MPDSSYGAIAVKPSRSGGWFSAWHAKPVLTGVNVFVVGFLLAGLRAANSGTLTDGRRDMTILLVSAALPSVTWLLLAHPAIRRRANGVRLLLGLVVIGGVVVYAISDRSRYTAVMTFGATTGPAVAFLVAQWAVRQNRDQLAQLRHQELVAAAAAAASAGTVVSDERRHGTVRSRARRRR